MSLNAFHLGQITLTVLGPLSCCGGRHGNAAPIPIGGETSETGHTHKQRSCKCVVLPTRQ